MMALESITAARDASTYELGFRSEDRRVEIRVVLDPSGQVTAAPAFDTVGPWTDVNDVLDTIVPAVRAFDRAVRASA